MHSNKHSRNCPICANNTTSTFHTFGEYRVVCCSMCGFVFQNPIYNKEHYYSLPCSYPQNYKEHSMNRAHYIINFCHEYIFDNRETINILDIGAGLGGVLYYVSSFFERSNRNVENSIGITLEKNVLKEEYKNCMYQFDFEDDVKVNEFINNNKKKFDFIIMSHVLEHFINPDKVIKQIKELITDDGVLYIEVPSLFNAEYRVKSVLTPEHLSYFTQTSLNRLLVKNGFYFQKNYLDSRVWGNIKQVYGYNSKLARHCGYHDENVNDVIKKYNSNKLNKFIQRLKHKLGFKYEANI